MDEKQNKPVETVSIVPSLFKPLVVEIGDQKFPVREINRKDQLKIDEFDDMIRNGDLDAQYKRLEFLLDLEKSNPAIDALSTREISDITEQLIKKLYSAAAGDMRFSGDTKNAQRRGNKKSAK